MVFDCYRARQAGALVVIDDIDDFSTTLRFCNFSFGREDHRFYERGLSRKNFPLAGCDFAFSWQPAPFPSHLELSKTGSGYLTQQVAAVLTGFSSEIKPSRRSCGNCGKLSALLFLAESFPSDVGAVEKLPL